MTTFKTTDLKKLSIWGMMISLATCLLIVGFWFIGKGATVIDGQRVFTLFDDAMISMTYARNLAQGFGLVWNAGESPVEGYTNPLWTAWLAFLHLSGLPDAQMGFLVSLSGLIILIANIFIIGVLTYNLSSKSRLATFTSISLTTFCFPIIFWTLRGMEVGLLTTLVNLIFLIIFNASESAWKLPTGWLTLLIGALVLTRMDAIILILPLIYYGFRQPEKNLKKDIWISCVAGGVGTLVILCISRKIYYGEWLPNTYYLKLTGVSGITRWSRGLESLYATIQTYLKMPVFLVLIAVIFSRKICTSIFCLISFFILQCLYSINVGGDAYEWSGITNRYISIALPILFVLCGWSIGLFSNWLSRKKGAYSFTAYALVVGVFGLNLYLNGNDMRRVFWERAFGVERDFEQSAIGLHFKKHVRNKASAGVFSAGSFCYFSHLKCIDFLGKSDKYIARLTPVETAHFTPGHNKSDFNYTIKFLKPDIIIGLFSEQLLSNFLKNNSEPPYYITMNQSIWLKKGLPWPETILNSSGISNQKFSDDTLEKILQIKKQIERSKVVLSLKIQITKLFNPLG